MPIERYYLADAKLAIFRYAGVIDMPTLLTAFAAHRRDPAFDAQMDVFADLGDVTAIELDFGHMRRLLSDAQAHHGDCMTRLSFFAPTELGFGMARMYQSLAECVSGWTKVFVARHRCAAFAALGLADQDLCVLVSRATKGSHLDLALG